MLGKKRAHHYTLDSHDIVTIVYLMFHSIAAFRDSYILFRLAMTVKTIPNVTLPVNMWRVGIIYRI